MQFNICFQKISETTICIPTQSGIDFILINHIIRIEAARAYCHLYMESGQKMIVSKSLKEIEQILPKEFFFRCHFSHIVNIFYIRQYIKQDGGFLIITNADRIPLATRRKEELLARFSKNK